MLQNASSPLLDDESISNTLEEEYSEKLQNKEAEIHDKEEKITGYKRELELLKMKVNESETFKIKEKALEAVIKLAAMSDVTSLGEE